MPQISALPADTTPAGTDEFAANQGGTSKKVTLSQINAYCEPVSAASTSAQSATFATDTYLGGSLVTVTPARLQAGSFYRLKFDASKTAAGTATAVVTLRMGTTGTTSDAAICALSFSSAQTAAIDSGLIEVMANFRSVGSGTTAVVAATLFLMKSATSATGFLSAGVANMAPVKVTSSGFDSSTVTKIGASLNAGTSAAWTVTTVQADMLNLT